MKKSLLVLSLLLCTLLFGCSDNYRAQGVNEVFPGCEVSRVPSTGNDFVVRKPDGSVWYVCCDNPFTNSVTSSSMVLPPK